MKQGKGRKRLPAGGAVIGVALAFAMGCSTAPKQAAAPPLRIGITADYPPLAMMQSGRITGLEVDLALQLGAELNRPVQFVLLKWREQMDALRDGRTDIIMSGLSVTPERKMQAQFIEPYMKNAVMGMERRSDAGTLTTAEDIAQFTGTIGVQPNTTAEVYVKTHCPQARVIRVADPAHAVYELNRKSMDLFLHDGSAIAWQVSENEGTVSGLWTPLTEEYLAWAVRRTDTELAAQANAALQTWKQDGRLKQLLDRWIPFTDRVQVPVGTNPDTPAP